MKWEIEIKYYFLPIALAIVMTLFCTEDYVNFC